MEKHSNLYGSTAAIDARHQIRLLELHPSVYNDLAIVCQLRPAQCSDSEYDALSYTWGNNSKHKSISLNKVTHFSVTDNLYAALRRLRWTNRPRPLWVDALCIDQGNMDERSQQVQLMGTIYRQAKRVIVWLGDANELEVVERSPFQPSAPLNMLVPTTASCSIPTANEDWVMRSLNVALTRTKPQWWKRTWIIQEAVLADQLYAAFGPFELSWKDLGTLREKMSAMMEISRSRIYTDEITAFMQNPQAAGTFGFHIQQYRLNDFDDAFQALETLRMYKDTWAGLTEIVSVTSQSEATDPKDRVYGYLGLWSGQDRDILNVDYRNSLAHVFADATFADMRVENNLATLNLVRPTDRRIERLPSWALDFSFGCFPDDLPSFPTTVIVAEDRKRPLNLGLDNGRKSLTVVGFLIDTVRDVHLLPRSFAYTVPEEDHLLAPAMASIPVGDAYQTLAARLTDHGQANDLFNCRSIPPDFTHSLTETFSVQGDPVSNVFLWWLSELGVQIPSKASFSELEQWWMGYARYHSWDGSSYRKGSREVFFTTECGFIGRGLPSVSHGDTVALLHGLELPVVLGVKGDGHVFKGLAWVNGAMMGELRVILKMMKEQTIRMV